MSIKELFIDKPVFLKHRYSSLCSPWKVNLNLRVMCNLSVGVGKEGVFFGFRTSFKSFFFCLLPFLTPCSLY